MNAPGTIPIDPVPYVAEGPQPLLREMPAGEPYPIHALGPLRDAVEAVADKTQAPPALAAQSALSVASLAVQGHADVETEGGGHAPASLFCLTVALSGERKTGCDRLLMSGLRAFEKEQQQEHREAREIYDLNHKLWTERRKRLINEATGKAQNKAVSAEADLRAMGPEPRPPLLPNVTTAEPTFPGLVKLFQAGRPSLGLFSDDAGGFIGGHAMNADNRLATVAGLSRLWSGDVLDRTRAGDGAALMPGRRLAMHLMAQAVAVYPLLNDPVASGQGFLARFLITEPPSHIGTRTRRGYGPKSDDALRYFAGRLEAILQTPLPTGEDEQELEPRQLTMTREAREVRWAYYEATERAQAPGGEYERHTAAASKACEQAARIAAVLTLWDNVRAEEVPADMMQRGVTLADYYLREAKRLSDAGAVSEDIARADKLRLWMLETWQHADITRTEILQHGPNSLRDTKAITPLTQILERNGWLEPLPEGTNVRGAARKAAWRVVRGTDGRA